MQHLHPHLIGQSGRGVRPVRCVQLQTAVVVRLSCVAGGGRGASGASTDGRGAAHVPAATLHACVPCREAPGLRGRPPSSLRLRPPLQLTTTTTVHTDVSDFPLATCLNETLLGKV